MSTKIIYLDNQATTAVDPRVVEKMLPIFTEHYGNAASRNHSLGWAADELVDIAREHIGDLIHADSSEIIFTSGATEANNLAIIGAARQNRQNGNHIITLKTEHKAVLDTCESLEKEGFTITYLDVQKDGIVDLDKLESSIKSETILISIMHGNNEIGVIQPITEIGKLCKSKGILFHVDAAQSAGKFAINVDVMGIDLLSISAHKMYGPKGIGCLYVRRKNPRVQLKAIIFGGGHERGLRSGTLPVPLIVGFGEACRICQESMIEESAKITKFRDRFLNGLNDQLDNISVNGSMVHRLPGNLNITFNSTNGESLIMGLSDIAFSTGSACTSATIAPSYVLKAIGLSDKQAYSSVRFGIGRFNTAEEIDHTIKRISETVMRLRGVAKS